MHETDARGPRGSKLSEGSEVVRWDSEVNGVSAKGRGICWGVASVRKSQKEQAG